MSTFAAAMDRIFTHASMAAPALWISATTSEERPIRTIRHTPDRVTEFGADFGAERFVSDTTAVDVRVADRRNFEAMGKTPVQRLHLAAKSGAPIVGLDPAFVMMLRQDYPKAGLNPPPVVLAQEFLAKELDAGRSLPKAGGKTSVRLLSHCTEATALPGAAAMWSRVFPAVGLHAETPQTGCCGMAGLFGHQKRHQEVSTRLFEISWREQVETDLPLSATGFSCRCQSERLGVRTLRHPLGLIAGLLA